MNEELPSDVRAVVGEKDLEKIAIEVAYTNYRGQTAQRRILPLSISYGTTEYHPAPQWLMNVWDLEKKAYRTYALAGIKKWVHVPVGGEGRDD